MPSFFFIESQVYCYPIFPTVIRESGGRGEVTPNSTFRQTSDLYQLIVISFPLVNDWLRSGHEISNGQWDLNKSLLLKCLGEFSFSSERNGELSLLLNMRVLVSLSSLRHEQGSTSLQSILEALC